MRRLWNVIVDIADGVIAGMLYGRLGGLTSWSYSAEAENADKLRAWAGGEKTHAGARDAERPDDVEARIERIRRNTATPREL